MYNNKTRQAEVPELNLRRPPSGRRRVPMFMMIALINILAISIILVLVLVLLVQKKNSAFGHAPSKDVIAGLHRISAESR